jgi:hypothetical protein
MVTMKAAVWVARVGSLQHLGSTVSSPHPLPHPLTRQKLLCPNILMKISTYTTQQLIQVHFSPA